MQLDASVQIQLEILGATMATNALLAQIIATLGKGSPLTDEEQASASRDAADIQSKCIRVALDAWRGQSSD